MAFVDGKHVPVPVNIDTINALFNASIKSDDEATAWLRNEQEHFPAPQNSEEMALSRVGPRLYSMLFRPYTIKQWDKEPADLGPSVLARIPVRNNHDPRYFTDLYQALPKNGYTAIFKKMFLSPHITVLTNVDYFDVRDSLQCGKLYYTGPIDAYFAHIGLPKLEYRSLVFERKVFRNVDKFQPNSVVNHPSPDRDYTRIVEYKHFLNQASPHTVIFYERSTDYGEPYYPVPNTANQALYAKYQAMAEQEHGIHFVGRLANYKYFNMDETIKNALDIFDQTRPDTLELVVSHCKESLEWVALWVQQLRICRVYVYNKCGTSVVLRISANVNVIALPNVGREGHSWLHHILRTKKSFSGRSIFVQGKPEVLLTDVISAASSNKKSIMFHESNPSISKWPCIPDGIEPNPPPGFTRRSYLEALYANITGQAPTPSSWCSFRGEFMVTNQLMYNIKRAHKDFLEHLYGLLSKNNDPNEGHMLERLWKTLFEFDTRNVKFTH